MATAIYVGNLLASAVVERLLGQKVRQTPGSLGPLAPLGTPGGQGLACASLPGLSLTALGEKSCTQ